MFTGIIETTGVIESVNPDRSNLELVVASPISSELKIDQSVAHNGVCLTVTKVQNNKHFVTAIAETLERTTLRLLQPGMQVNLERCMPANGRFDGHIVQGHVDTIAVCNKIENLNGSWKFYFQLDSNTTLTVQKGSVCIDGVSLTVVDSFDNGFSVAIIPYTFEHTNFKNLKVGSSVNIEFDIIGKYVAKMLNGRA